MCHFLHWQKEFCSGYTKNRLHAPAATKKKHDSDCHWFSNSNVLRGSMITCYRCGGIFIDPLYYHLLLACQGWNIKKSVNMVKLCQTRWLWYVMPTIHYSSRSARLSVHKLFTSCIRWGLVSRDSIVIGDWLPTTGWCQCYLACYQPASDVAENLGRFFVWSVQDRQGNDFELIPTVEMETRNPIVFW